MAGSTARRSGGSVVMVLVSTSLWLKQRLESSHWSGAAALQLGLVAHETKDLAGARLGQPYRRIGVGISVANGRGSAVEDYHRNIEPTRYEAMSASANSKCVHLPPAVIGNAASDIPLVQPVDEP